MPNRRVIGVDMGGTKLLAGAVDFELGVHHRVQRAVVDLDQSELIRTVVDAVEELARKAGAEIAAVGFGIPCLVDDRTRTAVYSTHLALGGVRFADVMAERLGLPVFVDNDGNVAALAEHRAGAARGIDDAVLLTIGTGVASGLILDGRLYRGATGSGAELGHMVIDMDGPLCQGNCPNRGCLEALVSGAALVREASRLAAEHPGSRLGRALADGREVVGPLITELAHDGDEVAIEALTVLGSRLGVGIANIVNIFNPEVVIVGGGVIAAGELLLAPARAVVAERALPYLRDVARIVPAHFGVEAGMVGAAALALDGLAAQGVPL